MPGPSCSHPVSPNFQAWRHVQVPVRASDSDVFVYLCLYIFVFVCMCLHVYLYIWICPQQMAVGVTEIRGGHFIAMADGTIRRAVQPTNAQGLKIFPVQSWTDFLLRWASTNLYSFDFSSLGSQIQSWQLTARFVGFEKQRLLVLIWRATYLAGFAGLFIYRFFMLRNSWVC